MVALPAQPRLAMTSFQESLSLGFIDKSRQAFTQYSLLVVGLQDPVVDLGRYLYCLLFDYYRFDSFHLLDNHRRWIIL